MLNADAIINKIKTGFYRNVPLEGVGVTYYKVKPERKLVAFEVGSLQVTIDTRFISVEYGSVEYDANWERDLTKLYSLFKDVALDRATVMRAERAYQIQYDDNMNLEFEGYRWTYYLMLELKRSDFIDFSSF